ncbi:sulfite reductase [NADPH] flavoprotein component [Coniosporium apollinis]|uniref:Sulfite reductase [NADPH] flavoprotein component n=1 Tax=Coniosporium apollinis TaxID=61459 RepID=A0ABQ9NKK0_9PEZI|nr:sulfite reductase [NADPH] flavoprotein component [Coniosporium apollinis]
MHFQQTQSAGSAAPADDQKPMKQFIQTSSSLPFGQSLQLSSISGPTYLTAQTLIQQVAYTLSDKLFAYSPETFDLDFAVKQWKEQGEKNAFGYTTGVSSLETRTGAGSIALGYMFSKDFDLSKRHIPQALVASASSLHQLRPALDQLSLLYSLANPLVAHVAAVDYAAGSSSGLVTDYVSALTIADELGLGLVSSASAYEIQHMSLFATLLASIVPTIHTYDGITVGRETIRINALDQAGLFRVYQSISKEISGPEKKHSDNEGRVVRLLKAFNEELDTDYKLFEYHGHSAPESVLVVFGTVEASLAAQVARSMAKQGSKVGVINVRVYRPFVEELFLEILPKSVQHVAVLGQVKDAVAVSDPSEHSRLFSDVLAAVSFSRQLSGIPFVDDVKYAREQVWTPAKLVSVFRQIGHKSASIGETINASEDLGGLDILDSSVQQYTFWDIAESASASAPLVLGQLLSADSSNYISVRTGHDNLVQGGVIRTDIRSSSKPIEASYSVDTADAAFVGDEKLLGEFDILNGLKDGGILVVKLPGAKDEDLEKRLTVGVRKAIFAKNVQLFILDPSASEKVAEDSTLETYLAQLAFLKAARNDALFASVQKLAAINGSEELLDSLAEELEKTLRQAKVPESWATIEPEVESISLPTNINVNSFTAFEKIDPEPPTLLKTWVTAAKGLAFKEAYGTRNALRPDLGIKTFVVHVKERRRLTPLSYDRNIFHIEFDLGDSGLTYAIGEALGIHAENDKVEVEEFIKWYGLNPSEIVEVPSREDPNVLENRTVYQSLLQNVDIFGRPPKRFYEALAEFADDENERRNLLALSTPDGATEFKRRAEVDTITYADILLEFPSAHPSFHDIVRIVAPLKRREYSIASSQRVTPNSVSLLIVTVGWVDPKGRDRFGQATRYLNGLVPGAPVTVSVKPSVMKLPPKPSAPIIMAGLGTGLAPFRAFVQERALQKQQGEEIGSILLYMGSRHQREEYLYGEEWEAYQDAGVITLLGRAFSRDQPQKIYIQDRMRQSLKEIREAYLRDEGSFYLCGPTWPVPDVTQVLQEAMEEEARAVGKKVDSRREIETLKDAGRYVLEVY